MSSDARDIRSLNDDGFHEIHLSGKQLVFLFMATTVVSIVIFLCGVLVGRGARPVLASGPSGLTGGATPAAAAAGETTAGDAEATEPIPGEDAEVKADGLTYYERLNQQQPAAERLEEPTPADETPGESEPAPAPAAPAATPAQNARSEAAATAPPSSGTAPPSSAKASTDVEPANPAPPAETRAAAPASGAWSVQVAALRQRSEADAVARRLVRKGYDAYVLAPAGGANRVYRVRVGRFASRDEADRLKNRLAREEQFKPWVTQ